MLVTALICVAIISFAMLLGYGLYRHQEVARNKEVRARIDQLVMLKTLLIYIQQHRGLTTGYLHGDQSLKPGIDDKMWRLNHHWQSTIKSYPELHDDSLFEGIYNHWDRLKDKWSSLSVQNNIDQHNRLITNLLHLIEKQAELNPALAHFSRRSGLAVLWRELLETLEAIGQTRAIGMGVVASGESTAIERIQLKFLLDKVSLRLSALEHALQPTQGKEIGLTWATPFMAKAKTQSKSLQSCVVENLLTDKQEGFSTEEFFKVASDAIEPLDELFGHASDLLKQQYFA